MVELHNAFAGNQGGHRLMPMGRVQPTGAAGTSLTIGAGITVRNTTTSQLTSLGNTSLPLIIEGTVLAQRSGQTLDINGSSVTNTGTLQAASGGILHLAVAPINFSGGTLTGGTWHASSGGTLCVTMPSGIISNAATIVLDGATSNFYRDVGTASGSANLTTNAAAGSLTLGGGQLLVVPADFANQGTLVVDATSRLSAGLAGQVSHWSAEGNANDAVDGNTGALVNGAGFASGQNGQAFSFDGVDDLITTPLVLSYASGITFSAWIRTTDYTGALMAGGGGATASRGMGLFLAPGGVLQLVGSKGTSGAQNFQILGPVVNNGQFHHLAATWNGTTAANGVSLYLDGTLVGSTTALATITTDTHALNFGGHSTIAYSKYAGLIDEIGYFNRALSVSEIQFVMNGGVYAFTQTAGSTTVNGVLSANPVTINGGTLGGRGTITGSLTNNSVVAPGNSPGCITINGNYNQSLAADLNIEIAGTVKCTLHDALIVNGGVVLGGDLNVSLTGGFVPIVGNTFEIITNDWPTRTAK